VHKDIHVPTSTVKKEKLNYLHYHSLTASLTSHNDFLILLFNDRGRIMGWSYFSLHFDIHSKDSILHFWPIINK